MNYLKLFIPGIMATLASGCAAIQAEAKQPNVILITVDDLGATDLGCFGSDFYETPNVDKLCQQGMKFSNAYAACQVCSPTRASILTGRYPVRNEVTDWMNHSQKNMMDEQAKNIKNPREMSPFQDTTIAPKPWVMPTDEVTIAEMLKPYGYITCHIGKWHLGDSKFHCPEAQGFDINIGGCHYGQPPSYYDPYSSKQRPAPKNITPHKKGEYLTDREGDEAVNFIRNHKDKPFFLNLSHYAVHSPHQPKKSLMAKYKNKKAGRHKFAEYATMIESVDQSCGKIMAELDKLGLAETTIIIFTSDNGGVDEPRWQVTDNHPYRGGKSFSYEGGLRVPQIIKWPGKVKAGSVCDEMVSSIDFLPTLAEACSVKLPKRKIDGVSMMPLLNGKQNLERDTLFWHYPHAQGNGPFSIVRSGDWKLIRYYSKTKRKNDKHCPDKGLYELFNLNKDISETSNLADSNPEKCKELEDKLEAHLKETNALIPGRFRRLNVTD